MIEGGNSSDLCVVVFQMIVRMWRGWTKKLVCSLTRQIFSVLSLV